MKRSTYTMRRLLALVLVLVMVGSLFAGCNKKTNDPTIPEEPSETTQQTAAPTDEPTEAPTEEPTEAPTEPVETVPPVLMGTVNADNLNVRSEPYSTADILKRLAINTRIEILEQKIVDGVNWGRIAEGWINLNYVTIGVEFPEPGTNNGTGSVVNNNTNIGTGSVTTNDNTNGTVTTGLNIRKDSNADSASVGTYSKGDKVTILERKGDWGRTNKGWINLKYVDFTNSVTSSGSSSGSSSSGTNSTTVSNGNSVPLGNGTVVKTTSLAIRSGPGANYTQVSYIRKGETHDYFQTSTNGWVRMKKGWVNADYLDLEYYVEDGTEVTVNVTELTVRMEADYNSEKLYTYEKGDEITILDVKGTWGMVEYTSGQYGWVDLDKVKLPTPTASNYSTGIATVTADALHIREKASASSDSLGVLEEGDKVDIIEVNGNWGKFEMDNGDYGWINLKYTKMKTTYTTGTGYVTASKLNVREEPDEDSDKIGSLSNGDKVIILDTEGTWGKILYDEDDDEYGWISLNYVKMTSTSTDSSSSGSSSTSGTKRTVTVESNGNGTIKASTSSCAQGTTVTLTATPATGYVLGTVSVVDANGNPVTVTNNTSFTMPNANVTVTATFVAATPYTITIGTVTGGTVTATISGSTVSQAAAGQRVYINATPKSNNMALSSITVKKTGTNETVTVTNNSYFTMPAAEVTITAAFATTSAQLYSVTKGTVTPSAGAAVITPSTTSAAAGTTVTLYIEPAAGYTLKSVTVKKGSDNVSVSGTGNTRTFTMPDGNVTYSAELEANQYKVNISSVTGGSVTANPTQCAVGSTVTISASASSGYQLTGVKVYGPNNELVKESTDSSFTFPMPAYNVTVKATVKKVNTITVTTPTHGTVTASATSAIAGTQVTLTATPADGYKLKSLAVNGSAITVSGNSGTFTMPDAAATITATFEYEPVVYVVSHDGGVNFRKVASSDSTADIIKLLPKGTEITSMEGSTSTWIKTTIDSQVGYVSTNRLTVK